MGAIFLEPPLSKFLNPALVTVTKLHQLVLIVLKVATKLYKAFERKEMRMNLCEEQSNCESLTKCRNWGKIVRRVISFHCSIIFVKSLIVI